jgi:hypothetical protein
MKVYKLTDQRMKTRDGFQYRLNRVRVAPGIGELCTAGWLHGYSDPLLAVLLNPVHADIQNPRLFEAEASGATKDDCGLKLGVQRLTLRKEMPLPVVTTAQRVRFAIFCALGIPQSPEFVRWANRWLSGEDRSPEAATAAAAAEAAEAAARAAAAQTAAWSAARAAAARVAARVAARAADAAAWAAAWAAEVAAAEAAAWAAAAAPLDLITLARKAMEEA